MTQEFKHTRKALAKWEAGEPVRKAAWDAVKTEKGVVRCQIKDEVALVLVQIAFYRDTYHINSMDYCRLVDIGDIRRMVGLK